MSSDHHADDRDRKRHRKRYGHRTTNPGMRIVMRDLAQKDRDDTDAPHVSPSSSPSKKRVRIERHRKKGHYSSGHTLQAALGGPTGGAPRRGNWAAEPSGTRRRGSRAATHWLYWPRAASGTPGRWRQPAARPALRP